MVEVEEDGKRFKEGRGGDNLICPFQFDLCHFKNLKGRDPGTIPANESLLMCIHRVIIDSLWARELTTVVANAIDCLHVVTIEGHLRLGDPFVPMGPFPVNDDNWGMQVAVVILM